MAKRSGCLTHPGSLQCLEAPPQSSASHNDAPPRSTLESLAQAMRAVPCSFMHACLSMPLMGALNSCSSSALESTVTSTFSTGQQPLKNTVNEECRSTALHSSCCGPPRKRTTSRSQRRTVPRTQRRERCPRCLPFFLLCALLMITSRDVQTVARSLHGREGALRDVVSIQTKTRERFKERNEGDCRSRPCPCGIERGPNVAVPPRDDAWCMRECDAPMCRRERRERPER